MKDRALKQRTPGTGENNMNQIKSIQLGVIAICIATVPLSLAQTPRTRTSGTNQTTITTTAAPRYGGSSGNSTGATQIGINAATANTKANTNAGAQTGTDTSVKTTQPQFVIETTQLPTLSTPTPSPTSTPTATPMASLAPAPSASVSPSPTPLL